MNSHRVLSKVTEGIKSRDLDNEMDYITLHLDVYDTAPDSLNPLVFDLVYLGGIEDSSTGQQYFWNSSLASISVEIPTGNILERLRICALLPRCDITVTGETFCISKKTSSTRNGRRF